MSIMRLSFSGEIKKSEIKDAGGKTLVKLSVCRKNYTKPGDEPTFTWVNVELWQPAEFQIPKLVKGNVIAGSGEFSLRSYTDKDGAKKVSADVRCTSYDVDVVEQAATGEQSAAIAHHAQKPYDSQAKRAAVDADAEAPF